MSYLDNGGMLYFESSDIGVNYTGTDFMSYLGIVLVDDGTDYEVLQIEGGNQCLTKDMHMFYNGGEDPHYSVDRLSSLGSQLMFGCESGHARMYMREADNYKVVASSLVIGAIANGDSLNLKPYLAAEIVNYFMGYDPTVSVSEPLAEMSASGSYPNPFSDQVTISYSLENSENVAVHIFDQQGKLVRSLAREHRSAGDHSVVWDGTGNGGNLLGNGLYIYTIESASGFVTGKMMLIR